jgi:hypothetical protein
MYLCQFHGYWIPGPQCHVALDLQHVRPLPPPLPAAIEPLLPLVADGGGDGAACGGGRHPAGGPQARRIQQLHLH